jgi:hypothetical protein
MAPPKKAPSLRFKIPKQAQRSVLTEPIIGGIAKKAHTIGSAYNAVAPLLDDKSRMKALKRWGIR